MGPRSFAPSAEAATEILSFAGEHASEYGFVWLDSSLQMPNRGTHSILAHRPLLEIGYTDRKMTMCEGARRTIRPATALGCLSVVTTLAEDQELTAIGYITYECCLELIGQTSTHQPAYPSMHFFLYSDVKECPLAARNLQDSSNMPPRPLSTVAAEIVGQRESRDTYSSKVMQIKRHIAEGDIYQANFTTGFTVVSSDSPFATYLRLRELSPAPYSGYLNFGGVQILSSSPERMLVLEGGCISTGPIKGTIAAGIGIEERELNRRQLLSSAKDRAELLMIVDLERNDLGKIAKPGSVKVDSLFRAEEYRSLFHLVADVSAEVQGGVLTSEVLQAVLPGGSISGAPKLRAIEILQHLEATPRGIYTGAIGYIRPGKTEFNIAIRTMVHQNGRYCIQAGGGIVADSDPAAEYDEMLLKASSMFRAVGLKEEQIHCLRR